MPDNSAPMGCTTTARTLVVLQVIILAALALLSARSDVVWATTRTASVDTREVRLQSQTPSLSSLLVSPCARN